MKVSGRSESTDGRSNVHVFTKPDVFAQLPQRLMCTLNFRVEGEEVQYVKNQMCEAVQMGIDGSKLYKCGSIHDCHISGDTKAYKVVFCQAHEMPFVRLNSSIKRALESLNYLYGTMVVSCLLKTEITKQYKSRFPHLVHP